LIQAGVQLDPGLRMFDIRFWERPAKRFNFSEVQLGNGTVLQLSLM
jgi:hypothetical protein